MNMTNDNYWDCECDTNYIHTKQIRECSRCGCHKDEQPDSIDREVKKFLKTYVVRTSEIVFHETEVLAVSFSEAKSLFEEGLVQEAPPYMRENWHIINIYPKNYP